MSDTHTQTPAPAGPISIEDVRTALADLAGGDPHGTNAGAVRRVLGRGSLSTIQRHLDTLRAEAAAALAPPETTPGVPPPPAELAEAMRAAASAIWPHAWAAAHASMALRVESIAHERDVARRGAEALRADLAVAQASIEDVESVLGRTQAAAAADLDEAIAERDAAVLEIAAAREATAAARAQVERLTAQAERDAERAAAAIAAVQAALDRSLGERARLESLLMALRPAAAAGSHAEPPSV